MVATHRPGGLPALDRNAYPIGINVVSAQMATVHIERDDFHSELNYIIRPCILHAQWLLTDRPKVHGGMDA